MLRDPYEYKLVVITSIIYTFLVLYFGLRESSSYEKCSQQALNNFCQILESETNSGENEGKGFFLIQESLNKDLYKIWQENHDFGKSKRHL